MKLKLNRNQQQKKRDEQFSSRSRIRWLLLAKFFWIGLAVLLGFDLSRFGMSSRFEAWAFFLGISGFVAAVWVGEAAFGQLNTLQEQLGVMRDQLGVMREQLADAYEAERPWIAFLDLEVEGTSAGAPLDGAIRAINSGRNPAKILAWTRDFAFIKEEASGPHPSPTGDSAQTGRILVPGRDMTTGFYVEWPEVLIRGDALHIFSEVRYADLRSGAEHSTKVCWCYHGVRAGPTGASCCQDYSGTT